MKLGRIRQVLEANQAGAREVLDVVAGAVEKRCGVRWTTHAELLAAAKVVLAEEKQSVSRGELAKRVTLRGELRKLATTLGLAAPLMRARGENSNGGHMANDIAADGRPKRKKSKVAKLAKAAALTGGLDW